jgi:DNA-directed RNA polymerase specialized sigma24 family protein
VTWLTDPLIRQITARLRERGADEDNIQDTFVRLLKLSEAPLDPVAMACTTALRLQMDRYRDARSHRERLVDHVSDPTLHHLSPDRTLTLQQRVLKHFEVISCPHPERPRYGAQEVCFTCYRRAWRAAKRTRKRGDTR